MGRSKAPKRKAVGKKSGDSQQKESGKERIIQAAIRCFTRQGVGTTRAVEIAREAGIAPPLFAYYYPTMEALIQDVVREALKSLRGSGQSAIENSQDDIVEALEKYVRSQTVWGESHRELFAIWMYFYYLATFAPEFVALNQEIRSNGRERIALLIYRGVERGIFKLPKGINAERMAWIIQATITGGGILAGTEEKSANSWAQASRNTIDAVLALLGVDARLSGSSQSAE